MFELSILQFISQLQKNMKVDSEILFINMAIVLSPVYYLIDSSGYHFGKLEWKDSRFFFMA